MSTATRVSFCTDGLLLAFTSSDSGTSMPTESQEESISSMKLTKPWSTSELRSLTPVLGVLGAFPLAANSSVQLEQILNMPPNTAPLVLELRLAITTESFDRLAAFYRQGLGLEPSQEWPQRPGALPRSGHGKSHAGGDLRREASHDRRPDGSRRPGQRPPSARVAGLPNLDAAIRRLKGFGATAVHPPIVAPWGDRARARFKDPDGMQVTLYESPGGSGSGHCASPSRLTTRWSRPGQPSVWVWRDTSLGLAGRLISRPLGGAIGGEAQAHG